MKDESTRLPPEKAIKRGAQRNNRVARTSSMYRGLLPILGSIAIMMRYRTRIVQTEPWPRTLLLWYDEARDSFGRLILTLELSCFGEIGLLLSRRARKKRFCAKDIGSICPMKKYFHKFLMPTRSPGLQSSLIIAVLNDLNDLPAALIYILDIKVATSAFSDHR